jgi:transcription elongation factor SPT6
LQDAQDIFGVHFDYEVDEIGENHDDEEDAYTNGEDEDQNGVRKKRARDKKACKGQVQKQSIFENWEPAELERGHWTIKDCKVRTTDIPERLQLRAVPVTGTNPVDGEEDEEIFDEAEWIYRNAFATPSISDQVCLHCRILFRFPVYIPLTS